MINFDDEDIQRHFNECHFRKEVGEVDICCGMCQPCDVTIEKGQCSMLAEYFSKQKGVRNE